MLYLFISYFFIPLVHAVIVTQVHRSRIFYPASSCFFLRNASSMVNPSIQSCTWECIYENNCCTAVYDYDHKVCSLFSETCSLNSIQAPSGNVRASVICCRRSYGAKTACPSIGATTVLTPASTSSRSTSTSPSTSSRSTSTSTSTSASSGSTSTSTSTSSIAISTGTSLISTSTTCTSCVIVPSHQNSASNYQVEHINFNCTSSLSNFTLVYVVKRSNNETYAQQYATFWSGITNMTAVQTASAVTYVWYTLPDAIINFAGFPYAAEAQFHHDSNGPSRYTGDDTWSMTFQSVCSDWVNYTGTF
ncbi:unnamed protein product [Adineta ricciae]|uniref:Apple domain-containing protein n=1 Tax=Adineta ricciae TaxID=249248 RepID=A0A814Y3D1_ADIRI|nr:unnamed protein product [Adineta ricciae]CAF1226399.1 unnamed protein product [Adineta ricciae]